MTFTLFDADRCPYCARTRIVLAEKRLPYETVVIDLADRPAWIYEKNPLGRVPVLEEGAFCLPESVVIAEYLEERYPDPPLLPDDPAERAFVRLAIEQFDSRFGDDYYGARRGDDVARQRLDHRLQEFDAILSAQPFLGGREYSLADIAYVPWFARAQSALGADLDAHPAVTAWLGRLAERPPVAAEIELVAALAR
jgi:glutathione S-transferase